MCYKYVHHIYQKLLLPWAVRLLGVAFLGQWLISFAACEGVLFGCISCILYLSISCLLA